MTDQNGPPNSSGPSRARACGSNRLVIEPGNGTRLQLDLTQRPRGGAMLLVRDDEGDRACLLLSADDLLQLRVWLTEAVAAPADRSSGRPLCASCDHWDGPQLVDDPALGWCRLNPPQTGGRGGKAWCLWPETREGDWCGQHSALQMVISGEPLPDFVLLGDDDPKADHPVFRQLAVEQAAQELGAKSAEHGGWLVREGNGWMACDDELLLQLARERQDAKLADVVPGEDTAVAHGGMPFGGQSN